MLLRLFTFLFSLSNLFYLSDACIPTQQTNSDGSSSSGNTLTTTTMTTTTTATEPPFPCSGCPKTYDATCTGFVKLGQPWCATAAEVGLSYTLGRFLLLSFGDANTCSTYYTCPLGTTSKVDVFGFSLPSMPFVFAYCQQTVTTTTMATTTTTADPGPASPCTGCPKIYDANCVGFQSITEPWCAPQSEVGNLYILGAILGWGDANTCSTSFYCPGATTSEYVLFGSTLPGPNLVIAWCQQDGANAGKWYYGIPPFALPVQLASLTCRGAYVPVPGRK